MTHTTNYEKNNQDFHSRIKDSKPNCFKSKIQELFQQIENEDLMQDLNIKPLKIVEDANFSLCNRPFPKEAFVVRGKAANRICNLKDDVSRMWNGGDVNIERFMKKYSKAENARNEGNGLEGFESTETVSFQIERNNLQLELSPELTLIATYLLVAKGSWFTNGHIEFGGADSVAKLVSGCKLWIMSQSVNTSRFLLKIRTFNQLLNFLIVKPGENVTTKYKGLFYHVGKSGDLIIQPSLFAHCVVTKEEKTKEDRRIWALVHGWEAINRNDMKLGRTVINNFCFGVTSSVIETLIKKHKSVDVVRRLSKARDWRTAVVKMSKTEDYNSSLRSFLGFTEHSSHLRAFSIADYNLLESFEAKEVRKKSVQKFKNLMQFKESSRIEDKVMKQQLNVLNEFQSLTEDEEMTFPLCAIADVFEDCEKVRNSFLLKVISSNSSSDEESDDDDEQKAMTKDSESKDEINISSDEDLNQIKSEAKSSHSGWRQKSH